jgi:hypothetical protein
MDFDPYFVPADPQQSWNLTFKAAPKPGVSMEFSRVWQQAWKDDKPDAGKPTEKTTSKLNVRRGDWNNTWTFSNEKFAFKTAGVVLKSDGYKGTVSATAESKYLKKQWKATGEAKLTTPDLGSCTIGADLTAEYDSTGATLVKPKINFLLSEEVFFGVAGEHDTKDLKKGIMQCVYAPKGRDGRYWVRGDLLNTLLSTGCDNKLSDTISHTFEGVYNWSGKAGILGYPLSLRGGVDYDLSDRTNTNISASWGSDVNVNQQVSHQCNANWTVTATQTFDQELLGTAQGAYHVGFGVTYKL